MWSTNAFLKSCEQLKELGLAPEFRKGERVARGFADLGYEEFYCLSEHSLVSIFTGHTTTLAPEHRGFFFPVFTEDFLTNEIQKSYYDLQSLEFENQRVWKAHMKSAKTGAALVETHAELLCALANSLITILKART